MFNVTIKKYGKPIKSMEIDTINAVEEFKNDILLLGKAAHQHMLVIIEAQTKTSVVNMRNSTPLTKAIDYKEFTTGEGIGWAIGDIDKLMIDSPHFRIINDGGLHPQAGKNVFVPGEFQGQGVFLYAPYSGRGIIVRAGTVIKPMNYIEETITFVNFELEKIQQKFRIRMSR